MAASLADQPHHYDQDSRAGFHVAHEKPRSALNALLDYGRI
jgi:hypothetical protein